MHADDAARCDEGIIYIAGGWGPKGHLRHLRATVSEHREEQRLQQRGDNWPGTHREPEEGPPRCTRHVYMATGIKHHEGESNTRLGNY